MAVAPCVAIWTSEGVFLPGFAEGFEDEFPKVLGGFGHGFWAFL